MRAVLLTAVLLGGAAGAGERLADTLDARGEDSDALEQDGRVEPPEPAEKFEPAEQREPEEPREPMAQRALALPGAGDLDETEPSALEQAWAEDASSAPPPPEDLVPVEDTLPLDHVEPESVALTRVGAPRPELFLHRLPVAGAEPPRSRRVSDELGMELRQAHARGDWLPSELNVAGWSPDGGRSVYARSEVWLALPNAPRLGAALNTSRVGAQTFVGAPEAHGSMRLLREGGLLPDVHVRATVLVPWASAGAVGELAAGTAKRFPLGRVRWSAAYRAAEESTDRYLLGFGADRSLGERVFLRTDAYLEQSQDALALYGGEGAVGVRLLRWLHLQGTLAVHRAGESTVPQLLLGLAGH